MTCLKTLSARLGYRIPVHRFRAKRSVGYGRSVASDDAFLGGIRAAVDECTRAPGYSGGRLADRLGGADADLPAVAAHGIGRQTRPLDPRGSGRVENPAGKVDQQRRVLLADVVRPRGVFSIYRPDTGHRTAQPVAGATLCLLALAGQRRVVAVAGLDSRPFVMRAGRARALGGEVGGTPRRDRRRSRSQPAFHFQKCGQCRVLAGISHLFAGRAGRLGVRGADDPGAGDGGQGHGVRAQFARRRFDPARGLVGCANHAAHRGQFAHRQQSGPNRQKSRVGRGLGRAILFQPGRLGALLRHFHFGDHRRTRCLAVRGHLETRQRHVGPHF